MPIRTLTPLVLACAVVALTSCADDGPQDLTAPTTGPEPTAAPVEPTGVVVEVLAIDNSFRPEVIEVAVGDEVVWVNRGRNDHDVIAVEGDDWGVVIDDFVPGAEYRHVFTEPGTYRYYCTVHATPDVGMIGTVVVSG